MKILHVISSVNPAGGGPVEGIKQLGTTLMAQGHGVEVASLDPPDAPYLAQAPLPVHPLGPTTLGYAYSPRFVPWLRANAGRYDAVIVNGIWQYHSFGTWRALHNSSTPYVLFTHGMLDPWFKKQYPLKHIKKWMYWPWAEYRVLRDARAVLFTCEEERRLARTSFWLYRCNEVVVNYGTAKPKGDPDSERREFFDHYPEARGKRLALFMGRIHPKKGCDLVIEAFAKVLRQQSRLASGDRRPRPGRIARRPELSRGAVGHRAARNLDRHAGWCHEVGRAARSGNFHAAFTSGKLRHSGGRGAGSRRPRAHFEQG